MNLKTGNAKGLIFINIREYIVKTYGHDIWDKVINELPASDRETLKKDFLRTGWYSAPLLNRLIKSYDLAVGNGDFNSVIPLAEYIAKKDLIPMFDIFVDLNNPVFVLNNAPSLWSRYFDSGVMDVNVLDIEKKHSVVELFENADENAASGAAICNYAVPEWFKIGLMKAGAESVKIMQTICRYQGAESCKYEIWWE
ncbi:MAG: hypothetical protein RIG61_12560 [Deltaproteobacteria bacterium]